MAFNGSGAFVRLYNWVSDRNAAIKIRADRMDAEMDGFATGLSNCITKDGQTTVSTDIPFNNKKLTGLADATGDSDALNKRTGVAIARANVTPAPQGRLSMSGTDAVQVSDTSGGTTINYFPYIGNLIPIYNGTDMVLTPFSILTGSTTDTTKNPSAIGASKLNDWFVWLDGSTVRLGHGPDWTSSTARSAGTAIERINGIWVNSVAITNGPAAQRGTYVGTARSNSSSQYDFLRGSIALNWGVALISYWNAYNRVETAKSIGDTTDSWTYASASWRAANGNGNTALVQMVRGLDEDAVSVIHKSPVATSSATGGARIGLGLDTTVSNSGLTGAAPTNGTADLMAAYDGLPGLGFHFLCAVEYSAAGTATFRGDNGEPSALQGGLAYRVKF